jgi:hypothetical protein
MWQLKMIVVIMIHFRHFFSYKRGGAGIMPSPTPELSPGVTVATAVDNQHWLFF